MIVQIITYQVARLCNVSQYCDSNHNARGPIVKVITRGGGRQSCYIRWNAARETWYPLACPKYPHINNGWNSYYFRSKDEMGCIVVVGAVDTVDNCANGGWQARILVKLSTTG